MDIPYPTAPDNVPVDLTKPTKSYKRNINITIVTLTFFCLLYLFLTFWFCYTTYKNTVALLDADDADIMKIIFTVCAGILSLFMVKSLFAFKKSTESRDYEITKEQQPELFQFIERLADETKAPKPHKVYLSHEVNASVFYDVSLLNLLIPSRKNLIIGLGLVNVLNLSEFKAVLAHEFGHFSQGSMAIGRWVWNLQMIARQLIYQKDWLDRFLDGLSRIDLRIAWVGWLLRLIIWSIRSLLDTVFSWVVMAELSLSREMEFQADLVAVGVSGSDALIHALHKLGAADDANSEALSVVQRLIGKKKALKDIFPLQSRLIEICRQILNDREYGKAPALPIESCATHRIFTPEIGQPPQMWSTHPHSHLREDNAKKIYLGAEIDERSAWCVFREPEALRASLTKHLISRVTTEIEGEVSPDAANFIVEKDYEKEYFDTKYRGVYLGRSVVMGVKSHEEMYTSLQADPITVLMGLYPAELEEEIEKLRNFNKEIGQLQAIKDGFLTPPGGVIRCRDGMVRKKELPATIDKLSKERDALREEIRAHDRLCRSAHVKAVEQESKAHSEYLTGLAAVLHYAEHTLADLQDIYGLVSNTFSIIIADGNVSAKERKRLVMDCSKLHIALRDVFTEAKNIQLDREVLAKLKEPSWMACLEEFTLGAPLENNIQEWLNVMEGWFDSAAGPLSELAGIALELLLIEEANIRAYFLNQEELLPVPSTASVVVPLYTTLCVGSERALQNKLNLWDSFQTATGVFPTMLRFTVSASIIVGVIWSSWP